MSNTEHLEAILKKTNLKHAELRGIIENLKNGFIVKPLREHFSELNRDLKAKNDELEKISILDSDDEDKSDKNIEALKYNIKLIKKEIGDIERILNLDDDSSLILYEIAKDEVGI